MKGKNVDKILNITIPIITIIVLFMVWFISAYNIKDEIILPNPALVLKETFRLFGNNKFYIAYFNTFSRSLIAFFSAFSIALILAILSKISVVAKRTVLTLIPIIRALPTIAVVLLLLLWTSSTVAPVIVTSLVILPTVYTNLYEAFNEIDDDLVEMCRVYGLSRFKQFFKVYIPLILPSLFVTIGSGLSLNIKLMVAAEVLSSTINSFGSLMNDAKIYFETAKLLALVLISVLTGLFFEILGNVAAKKLRSER